MKKNSEKRMIIILYICMAFMIMIATYLTIQDYNVINHGVKTQATITNIKVTTDGDEKDYRVFIKYTVDNKEYNQELGTYIGGMKEGQTINIWCFPDNPTKIVYKKSTNISLFIFYILAFSFGGISTYLLVKKIKFYNLQKLKKTGEKVIATITDVMVNTSMRMNGNCLLQITCQNNLDEYKSLKVYEKIPAKIGDEVDVYIDQEKEKYFVDIYNIRSKISNE